MPHILVFMMLVPLLLSAAGSERAVTSVSSNQAAKDIVVTARRYTFEPQRIEVVQGDRVRLVVRSADGKHGIEIKKLKIRAEVPKGGDPVTIEFVAAHAGSFEIVCSEYCGNGHKRMKGLLVVVPRPGEQGSTREASPNTGLLTKTAT